MIKNFKKKLGLSLITIALFSSNANAVVYGMTSLEFIAAQTGMDTANWGLSTAFEQTLSEFNLQNTILSGQAGFNGNKAYDAALSKTSELGGAYGKQVAGIMDSCFGLELPSFSKSLGLDGLSFCGFGDVASLVNDAMKEKASGIQPQADIGKPLTQVKEKVKTTPGKITQPKVNGAKNNCIEGIDIGCKEKTKDAVDKERKDGVGKGGESTTLALKKEAQKFFYSQGNPDAEKENPICVDTEWGDATTASYACRKDIVEDIGKYDEAKESLASNNSKLLDATPDDVRNNMIKANEEVAEKATSRANTSREIRDEYNLKYNPNTLVLEDTKNMGGESFYERNKDMLTKDPTVYIVPTLDKKTKQFGYTKFGLEKYEEAITKFNEFELTDMDDNVIESKEQVKDNVNRLGGVTPLSSGLYGYEASLSAMANDVFGAEGEKGSTGREIAILNGLKGVMYQTLLVNQQLENATRSNYNIRIKEFTKISQDNDNLNNKVEQMQNQNMIIINLLRDINTTLDKISNK